MEDMVSVDKVSDIEYKISIVVSPDSVDSKFNDFFNGIKKQVNVPGFRKGMAPLSMLKQFYYNKAQPTVAQMLFSEYYVQAIKDNNINPVTSPKFDNSKQYPGVFRDDKSYSVDMTVEVLPDFVPSGYEGLELSHEKFDDDELYNKKMMEYREKFAERTQITDRGAKYDDSLVIDFTGFIDDKPFDGGTAQGFSINKLGQGSLISGFEEQLRGVCSGGNKDVNVKFPDDYNVNELAGKNVRFNVTVQSIIESKPADIDEDLALMCGFDSVEELEKSVSEEVKAHKIHNKRNSMERQIISRLLEINEFNIPLSMIDSEKVRLSSNVKYDKLPDNIKQELEKLATYNVKRAILLDKIYENSDEIEVSPEILNDVLEKQAMQVNQSKDELVSNLYNSGKMDAFVASLREQRVIDYIIDKSININNG